MWTISPDQAGHEREIKRRHACIVVSYLYHMYNRMLLLVGRPKNCNNIITDDITWPVCSYCGEFIPVLSQPILRPSIRRSLESLWSRQFRLKRPSVQLYMKGEGDDAADEDGGGRTGSSMYVMNCVWRSIQ